MGYGAALVTFNRNRPVPSNASYFARSHYWQAAPAASNRYSPKEKTPILE
jgi:hypothetical protein